MTVDNTFSSGVNTDFSTELNTNFTQCDNRGIKQIYTGTGFDVSVSGANQDTSNSQELDSISSTDLTGMIYLTINPNVIIDLASDQLANSRVYMKIETKEIGGSYSDTFSETKVYETFQDSASTSYIESLKSFKHVHTLTSGEKSSGVQVKITFRCTTGNDSGNEAAVSNVQTILRTEA